MKDKLGLASADETGEALDKGLTAIDASLKKVRETTSKCVNPRSRYKAPKGASTSIVPHAVQAAPDPVKLMFSAIGIVPDTLIGALPGLCSVIAMVVRIQLTAYLSPLTSIAFRAGVHKGGTSGGAIPVVLLNSPGPPEAASGPSSGPWCGT